MSLSKIELIRQFKIDIYNVLDVIFNNASPYYSAELCINNSNQMIDGTTQGTSHHFSRDKFRQYNNPRYIIMTATGEKLALTQLRPDKSILVFSGRKEYRYYRNLLLKTLSESFPQVQLVDELANKKKVNNTTPLPLG